MASQQIRIRLKSYEHGILDESAAKIVATAEKNWSTNFWSCSYLRKELYSLFYVHHKNKRFT